MLINLATSWLIIILIPFIRLEYFEHNLYIFSSLKYCGLIFSGCSPKQDKPSELT